MRTWRDWVRDNDPVYAAARRPGTAEKWAAGVVLVLVAAVVLFVALFDWNMLRGPIGRWASVKYDREIALTGDLDVNLFSWTPSAVVRGLKIGGPDWARDRESAASLHRGERVEITMTNPTSMAHPMHLHGMWSDLEDENGNFMVRKHTIDMPPGSKRSYRVTADALGRWAYHCHLMFHMETGMFREVRVDE